MAKPFVRGGVTYPSQIAYRNALARRRGFQDYSEYRAVTGKVRKQPELERLLRSFPRRDRGDAAAFLAQSKGKLGPFREVGASAYDREAARRRYPLGVQQFLDKYEDQLDDEIYPIWRWLYT